MKIKLWVEALGKDRSEIIDTYEFFGISDEDWSNLTEEERTAFVEDWAYNEVQMGYGYDEL